MKDGLYMMYNYYTPYPRFIINNNLIANDGTFVIIPITTDKATLLFELDDENPNNIL